MAALETKWAEKNLKLLNFKNTLYTYRDGYWRVMTPVELDLITADIYSEAADMNVCAPEKEGPIWRMIKVHFTPSHAVDFDKTPALALRNGTFFVEKDRLRKHDPSHYVTRHLDIEYRPKDKCPEWLAMLDRVFEDYEPSDREQIIRFLQEWFGVSIVGGSGVMNNRNLRKGIFLKGPKGGGKSTIADVLRTMMGGPEHCAALQLSSVATQFGLSALIGKSAIVSDDGIDPETKAPAGAMKTLITGEYRTVDRKNKDAIQFKFDGPVMFTTNSLPRLRDVGNAFYDRYVVIEVTRTFDAKDARKTLNGHASGIELLKAEDEFPGILNWALDGYDTAMERGRLIIPKTARTAQEAFRRSNDVIFDFIRECCELDESVSNVCSLVSGVATEYAMSAHGVRIGAKAAGNSLVETVRNTMPKVRVAQVNYGSYGQERSYVGLKLNARGISYKDRAVQNDVPAVKMHKGKINVPSR